MEQDEELMEDWDTLNIIYIRVGAGVLSSPPIPQNAPAWQNLVGD